MSGSGKAAKRWRVTARPPKGRDGGWWQLRIYPPEGGPSKQRTARPATTRGEAELQARKLEIALNAGASRSAAGVPDLTVAQVMRLHLEELRETGAPQTTINCTVTALRRAGSPLGDDLSSLNVIALQTRLRREGLAGRTINSYLDLCHLSLDWGRLRGLTKATWPEVKRLRVVETDQRPLTPEEIARLDAYFAEDRRAWTWPYFGLLAATGARCMELAQLEERDLDRARCRVTFRREVTKTGRRRFVVVPAEVLERVPVSEGRLWPRLPYSSLRRVWRQAVGAVGLGEEPIGLHSYRRAWVCDAFEAGVPLNRIMAALGHMKPATTLRYEILAQGRNLAAASADLAAYREAAARGAS